MNNVYVDELPKKGACLNGCPYAVTDTWVSYCPFQQDENGDHLIVEEDCIKTCPLKPVNDLEAKFTDIIITELNKLRELMTKKVDSITDESLKLSFRTFVFTMSNAIDQRINTLKGENSDN